MRKDMSYQLNRVDLNLLVAFDTLLKERNVTNAAKGVICVTVGHESQLKTAERNL